ncbi:Chondroitinase-B precursor [Microbacterium hydrocarbonoxydans]|uniref:Chondroitinase-B n=1 Tax=Microbacterium hydrocarbonoxydans TaxID=273678 RepID=A0A0M2HV91_9MICO|nr:chondroitinase-B domain-containing protein [Microbacterium hydrocarbonoxydans]KJL48830.1 Chondroitinase-B precursor [Microbacterium hydrocarbonoxydans]
MMNTTQRVIAVLAAATLSLTCVPAMAGAAEIAPQPAALALPAGQTGPLTAAEVGPLAETLISQGRPATASSLETSSFPASAAVDGSSTTRWASQEGIDPQWITVDLGEGATVSRVLLNWEAAYASTYTVQISADGTNWTTLKDETAGDGGTDDITGLSGTGRYLRVYGTARGTSYGYSLYELQVYGTPGSSGGTGSTGQTTTVTSISALQSAIDSSDPGDTIVLKNGSYSVSSAVSLGSGASGTSTEPVTIKAETVGGVTLTGASSFSFSGVHDISIQGFRFTQSTTMDVGSSSKAVDFVRNEFVFAQSAEHNLIVRSDDSEIAYNWFHGKSTIGVYLGIEGPGTDTVAKNTHIHHNYFSDQTFTGTNGGESIRLGTSPKALSSGNAIVEYNLFEHADGDPEAISVKSSGHTIRYNTIRNSKGGIVLRHGNGNKVLSNYILNGGNGIRIYGNDHVIMNNYVSWVTGTDAAGIVIGSGTVRDHFVGESETSRKQYDAPDRIRIGLNTLVNNSNGILGETKRTVPPLNVTIVDNIVQGASGYLASVPLMQDFYWRGNILWGSAANGNIPTVGYTRVNPQLAQDATGVWKIGSSSPAVNAAFMTDHGTWVTDDIEGRQRAGVYDVGAHEVTTSPATRAPLTTVVVGPTAP